MKFVDVTNDLAFRKIFGSESRKEVLISFLNAVLDFSEAQKVVDVSILNPYQLPKLSGGKSTIVDVKAQDQTGKTFIVEMQIAEVEDFHKRVLYYTAHSYSEQIHRGDEYNKLNPAYFIGILEFTVSKNENCISRHRVLDVETGENIIQDIEFNFIELPKFNKKESELNSIIDQWIYFIKNAENLEVIPENIGDEGLKTAYQAADQHGWSKQELDDYNKIFIREADDKGKLTLAEKRGEEKGKIEGKIEVAKKAKLLGLSITDIVNLTGLSIEEIEQL